MTSSSELARFTGRMGQTCLDEALGFVARFAQTHALSPETATRLQIVIEELITNAMTHGKQPADQAIELEVQKECGCLRLCYRDHGELFYPPITGLVKRQSDKEGGFGWLLIRGFCSEIRHERADPGNRLELTIPIDDAST